MYTRLDHTSFFVIAHSYKNALDGLLRVVQEEGVRRLFSGCSTATMRAVLMTIGQLSFYDQIKTTLLQTGYFRDSPSTHILSSVSAVSYMNNILRAGRYVYFKRLLHTSSSVYVNRVLLQQRSHNL